MHEAATPAWVLLAYLIAGVCFILALRGLSGPESSRRGNRTGMLGMAIAVVTTLVVHLHPEYSTGCEGPGSFLCKVGLPSFLSENFFLILLAVAIGENDAVPLFMEPRCQVNGNGAFANTPLRIRNHDNHAATLQAVWQAGKHYFMQASNPACQLAGQLAAWQSCLLAICPGGA